MVFDLIFLISLVVTVLLVWFNSEAFVEYAKLIGGAKFFKVTEYEKQQEKTPTLDYLSYLLENKNSFFIRLITCPLCLGFWLSAVACVWIAKDAMLIPICYVLSLIVYKFTSNLLES
tara:strand:- start:171 stop:521 length:351 start_codon:yes stop_codon:yes gene_type:complete